MRIRIITVTFLAVATATSGFSAVFGDAHALLQTARRRAANTQPIKGRAVPSHEQPKDEQHRALTPRRRESLGFSMGLPDGTALILQRDIIIPQGESSARIGTGCDLVADQIDYKRDRIIFAGASITLRAPASSVRDYDTYETVSPGLGAPIKVVCGRSLLPISLLASEALTNGIRLALPPSSPVSTGFSSSVLKRDPAAQAAAEKRSIESLALSTEITLPKGLVIPAFIDDLPLLNETKKCRLIVERSQIDRVLDAPALLRVSSVDWPNGQVALEGGGFIKGLTVFGDRICHSSERTYDGYGSSWGGDTYCDYERLSTIGQLADCLRAIGGDLIVPERAPY